MIAAVFHEPKNLVIEEQDIPELMRGQVLIRVRAGGICGSDLSYYFRGQNGGFVIREPFVLGMRRRVKLPLLVKALAGCMPVREWP